MAKKVQAMVKLQIPAGKATPAPPVGTALGPHGVNIMDFCKSFNERTKDNPGLVVPAVITIYKDRSFTFEVKSPPAAVLIKRAAKVAKAFLAHRPDERDRAGSLDAEADDGPCDPQHDGKAPTIVSNPGPSQHAPVAFHRDVGAFGKYRIEMRRDRDQ